MVRNYNSHEVHPITYIFVVFLLIVTLVGIAPLFNSSSRDIKSNAQTTNVHCTSTYSQCTSACRALGSECVLCGGEGTSAKYKCASSTSIPSFCRRSDPACENRLANCGGTNNNVVLKCKLNQGVIGCPNYYIRTSWYDINCNNGDEVYYYQCRESGNSASCVPHCQDGEAHVRLCEITNGGSYCGDPDMSGSIPENPGVYYSTKLYGCRYRNVSSECTHLNWQPYVKQDCSVLNGKPGYCKDLGGGEAVCRQRTL